MNNTIEIKIDGKKLFTLNRADAHGFIYGRPGTGKTNLLKNLLKPFADNPYASVVWVDFKGVDSIPYEMEENFKIYNQHMELLGDKILDEIAEDVRHRVELFKKHKYHGGDCNELKRKLILLDELSVDIIKNNIHTLETVLRLGPSAGVHVLVTSQDKNIKEIFMGYLPNLIKYEVETSTECDESKCKGYVTVIHEDKVEKSYIPFSG